MKEHTSLGVETGSVPGAVDFSLAEETFFKGGTVVGALGAKGEDLVALLDQEQLLAVSLVKFHPASQKKTPITTRQRIALVSWINSLSGRSAALHRLYSWAWLESISSSPSVEGPAVGKSKECQVWSHLLSTSGCDLPASTRWSFLLTLVQMVPMLRAFWRWNKIFSTVRPTSEYVWRDNQYKQRTASTGEYQSCSPASTSQARITRAGTNNWRLCCPVLFSVFLCRSPLSHCLVQGLSLARHFR